MYEPVARRQGYGWAEPVVGDLYEVAFPTPMVGDCYVFFAFPMSGIGYAHLPHLILQTSEEGTTVFSRAPEPGPADGECLASA